MTQQDIINPKIEGIQSSTRHTNYTLHITNNRLIFIKTNKANYTPTYGGLLGGLLSEGIFQLQKHKEKNQPTNLTLNQQLEQIKGSKAINYTEIKELILRAGWTSEIGITLTNNKREQFWTEKLQIKQLNEELTKSQSLNGKIKLIT